MKSRLYGVTALAMHSARPAIAAPRPASVPPLVAMFRSASNDLRSDNETLASYVDLAGDQMRRLAGHIRERGVADMLDDVHAFARRRPALFIGSAFLVGLGVARFLKSSADRGGIRRYNNFSSADPMSAPTGSPSYSGDFGEVGGY